MNIARSCILLSSLLFLSCSANESDSYGSFAGKALVSFQQENNIKGIAFALFDKENVIDSAFLGYSSYGYPVDGSTLFSLQSISKNITALATMVAVDMGLVELDSPVSYYLPEFSVNSCHLDNPTDSITLRILLNHTAGFTHEAPVGNNYDYQKVNKDDHWTSIEETWLKFRPGFKFSYSNLGYDLMARIIEEVSGQSYSEFVKENVLIRSACLFLH